MYYFERSGDLNHRVESESVPVLEASWAAARQADNLRYLGANLLAHAADDSRAVSAAQVEDSLSRLDTELSRVNSVESLQPHAVAVFAGANDVADVINDLSVNRIATLQANEEAARLQEQLDALEISDDVSLAAAQVLARMLLVEDEATLNELRAEFETVATSGASPAVRALWEGDGIFTVRAEQLALRAQAEQFALEFAQSGTGLEDSVAVLLEEARAESSAMLDAAVRSFDEGRVLLASSAWPAWWRRRSQRGCGWATGWSGDCPGCQTGCAAWRRATWKRRCRR